MTLDLHDSTKNLDLARPGVLLTSELKIIDTSEWRGWAVVILTCLQRIFGLSGGDKFDIIKVAESVERTAMNQMQLVAEDSKKGVISKNAKNVLVVLKSKVGQQDVARLRALNNTIARIEALIPRVSSAQSPASAARPHPGQASAEFGLPPVWSGGNAAQPTVPVYFPPAGSSITAPAAAGSAAAAPAPAVGSLLATPATTEALTAARKTLRILGLEMLRRHPGGGDFGTASLNVAMLVATWANSISPEDAEGVRKREEMLRVKFGVPKTITCEQFFAAVCQLQEDVLTTIPETAAGQCFVVKGEGGDSVKRRLKTLFTRLGVFTSVADAHAWLSNLTHGLITSIFPDTLTFRWGIGSAVYGKFEWVIKFNKPRTNASAKEQYPGDKNFKLSNGKVVSNVPMMWHKNMPGCYFSNINAEVMGLPYKVERGLLMHWIVKPKDGVPLEALDIDKLIGSAAMEPGNWCDGEVQMPRTRSECENGGLLADLTGILGVAFVPEGFPAPDGGCEKVVVVTDHEGSRGGAAGSVYLARGGGPVKPVFIFDRSAFVVFSFTSVGQDERPEQVRQDHMRSIELIRLRIDSAKSLSDVTA